MGSAHLAARRRTRLQLAADTWFSKNRSALARAIGRPAAQVADMIDGRKAFGEKIARDIESKLAGPPCFMRASWLDEPDPASDADDPPTTIIFENNDDYPSIRRVRFKLSAGASGFAVDYLDDDAAPIVFQREWFADRGYQPSKLLAVRVANGSMEPGLWPGDTVVVNTGDTEPRDGEVFAINFEGELVIKRLVRDEGRWWMKSDNPDQSRFPRKLCGDGVFLLGRIVHKQSERV